MADDAVVIELAAAPATGSMLRSLDACWADSEAPASPWACGAKAADDLGLCAFHRRQLFGIVRP